MSTIALPPALPALVKRCEDAPIEGVHFRASTWVNVLGTEVTALLVSDEFTTEAQNARYRASGERIVQRGAVLDACRRLTLKDYPRVCPGDGLGLRYLEFS